MSVSQEEQAQSVIARDESVPTFKYGRVFLPTPPSPPSTPSPSTLLPSKDKTEGKKNANGLKEKGKRPCGEITATAVHPKFFVVGTSLGYLVLLDVSGNQINKWRVHDSGIEDLCIGEGGECVASCSRDGAVVVTSLYTQVQRRIPLRRFCDTVALPVSLHPHIVSKWARNKQTAAVAVGGADFKLQLASPGAVYGYKHKVVDSRNDHGANVMCVRWAGDCLVWASRQDGFKIYDLTNSRVIHTIPRREPASHLRLPPIRRRGAAYLDDHDAAVGSDVQEQYRPCIAWVQSSTLVLAWGDQVTVGTLVPRGFRDNGKSLYEGERPSRDAPFKSPVNDGRHVEMSKLEQLPGVKGKSSREVTEQRLLNLHARKEEHQTYDFHLRASFITNYLILGIGMVDTRHMDLALLALPLPSAHSRYRERHLQQQQQQQSRKGSSEPASRKGSSSQPVSRKNSSPLPSQPTSRKTSSSDQLPPIPNSKQDTDCDAENAVDLHLLSMDGAMLASNRIRWTTARTHAQTIHAQNKKGLEVVAEENNSSEDQNKSTGNSSNRKWLPREIGLQASQGPLCGDGNLFIHTPKDVIRVSVLQSDRENSNNNNNNSTDNSLTEEELLDMSDVIITANPLDVVGELKPWASASAIGSPSTSRRQSAIFMSPTYVGGLDGTSLHFSNGLPVGLIQNFLDQDLWERHDDGPRTRRTSSAVSETQEQQKGGGEEEYTEIRAVRLSNSHSSARKRSSMDISALSKEVESFLQYDLEEREFKYYLDHGSHQHAQAQGLAQGNAADAEPQTQAQQEEQRS